MTLAQKLRPVPLADQDEPTREPIWSGPIDRMIAIQAEAYPSSWSDADKREMAEIHLWRNAL